MKNKKVIAGIIAVLIAAAVGIGITVAVNKGGNSESGNDIKVESTQTPSADKDGKDEKSDNESEKETEKDKTDNKDNEKKDIKLEDDKGEVMTEKPVFMYFMSAKDEKHDETKKILEDLQKEYEEKVMFRIMDVDEHPEYVEQFSLNAFNPDGGTPMLIMLDTKGQFKDLKAGFADKKTLEKSIAKAIE